MRLIGNKTRLVPTIEEFLAERGVTSGSFLDVFAGSGAVARHFRGRGFRVRANDLLVASATRQRAYLTLDGPPGLARVRRLPALRRFRRAWQDGGGSPAAAGLREVIAYLDRLPPAPGLFARQYSEGGAAGRLYFSAENGARIDAIHAALSGWWREGLLSDEELSVLLTALLEAADRVANISGTYGAFLKQLQTSARERLSLRVPALEGGPRGRVYNEDANRLVRRLKVDVLYLDPPYNQRQYAKNYHVLEVLAELHRVEDLRAYEAGIYGKTGLRAFEDRLSSYCRKRQRRDAPSCAQAFADLVASARAEHVVVSYNEEGILSREEIGEALARAAGTSSYDYERDHLEIGYRRFRSDSDRAGRRYQHLEGRARDEVAEWLFYVHKPTSRRARRVA
ncbi:MAG: DNA adenine methylase [Planctomycetota bacterium]